jgi:hypothetical protein
VTIRCARSSRGNTRASADSTARSGHDSRADAGGRLRLNTPSLPAHAEGPNWVVAGGLTGTGDRARAQ